MLSEIVIFKLLSSDKFINSKSSPPSYGWFRNNYREWIESQFT